MIRIILVLNLSILLNISHAQISGCTDPIAINYNEQATRNDGTCVYDAVTVTPVKSWILPESMFESSGLILWNNKIWTHNDNTDINLYAFETDELNNYKEYPVAGALNIDWEEISQDSNYIYVGDFGNNSNGNRTNLQILRIEKNSILTDKPDVDTISFSYSLQTDFSATGNNNTDFDCEAFIVTADSIFLFTKEWVSKRSSVYSLPKVPGNYVARYRTSFNVEGLISGATYMEKGKLVVLCGYSSLLQPFLYLLYDFNKNDFFSGNKRKILINLPFHQVEGIATNDGLMYYISNEKLDQAITIDQKLHQVDLSDYLEDFLNTTKTDNISVLKELEIYPNPSSSIVTVKVNTDLTGEYYSIIDLSGKNIFTHQIDEEVFQINLNDFDKGFYLFVLKSPKKLITRKIVKN